MAEKWLNTFVGAETGLLKGISGQSKHWENLNSLENVSKENEINEMCWGNAEQTQISYGTRNCVVHELDLGEKKLQTSHELGDEGPLRGLAKYNDSYITCTKGGVLKVWQPGKKTKLEMAVGPDIYKMRQSSCSPHLVATGGKENDLTIYDLSSKDNEPIFKAKNVRHNWLELRVPVWVTDMAFLGDGDKIVTSTGYHQVRVYDPKTQRRPVLDFEFDEHPITCLCLHPAQSQIVVGNTMGTMALLDIRKNGCIVHKFRGFAGSVSAVQCHAEQGVIVSCSQDRFLRVHDIDSTQLINKIYLKSRLNCLLLSDKWDETVAANQEQEDKMTNEIEEDNDVEQSGSEDEVWESLSVVETKKLKRKPKHYHVTDKKQRRETDQGDTTVESNVRKLKKHQGKTKKAKSKGT